MYDYNPRQHAALAFFAETLREAGKPLRGEAAKKALAHGHVTKDGVEYIPSDSPVVRAAVRSQSDTGVDPQAVSVASGSAIETVVDDERAALAKSVHDAIAAAAGAAAALATSRTKEIIQHVSPGDDLKRIRGINAQTESQLFAKGIRTYRDLALLSYDMQKNLEWSVHEGTRANREKWIEQAQILASGGQTEFSRRYDGERLAERLRADGVSLGGQAWF